MNRVLYVLVFALFGTQSASLANGQVISADLLLKGGDTVGSSNAEFLSAPFINGLGQVGFLTVLEDGSRSIVIDGTEVFNSADALPDVLEGGESTMGIGNNGEFIYSPSFNGEDAVFGEDGLILVENTQAPGFATGINSTFHSRPQMSNDGTAYWIAGFNDGAGGTSTEGRVLYRRNPNGTIDIVLRSGDTVGAETVADGSGVSFDYKFSGNGSHSAIEFSADNGSSTTDGRLMVDGAVVAAEGSSTGQGDNWDNFDDISINNSGNFVFSGDTDGSTTTDEFLAFNGVIQLREGDALAGGILDGSVDGHALNNADMAAFIFDLDTGAGGVETLFFTDDASTLTDAFALASVGDELDVDGNGTADWILNDFNGFGGSGPAIALSEGGVVYVEVDLLSLDGSTNVEAIVGFSGISAIPEPTATLFLLAGSTLILSQRRRLQ